MSSDTDRLRDKLAVLESSLDDLESKLEPLFSQTLAESAVGLETAQQAKLQVLFCLQLPNVSHARMLVGACKFAETIYCCGVPAS